MKLILGFGGGGSGYYPYTQKPVDYQPYRPVYLFRGPPPDAGFSYGLFEDEEAGKKYYADLGLDSFSPLSGKSAKLLEELSHKEIERLLGDDLKKENLQQKACPYCSSEYFDNFHLGLKGRDNVFCHRCGSKLPAEPDKKPEEGKVEEKESMAATALKTVNVQSVEQDPDVKKFIEIGLQNILKSTQMKELSERVATRLSVPAEQVKHGILLALKNAIK